MPIAIADTEMINQTFGRWTVLSKVETPPGAKKKWLCQCECGTIREVNGSSLRTGRSQSCGCLSKEKHMVDLTNQIFGELTVLEPTSKREDGSVVWKCLCSCGKQCDVSAHNLRRGSTKSCGHLLGQNLTEGKDITNMRFGKLVALEPTQERKNKSIVWKCQCDCGTTTFVSIHLLQQGKTKSCGCLKTSLGEEKIEKLLTEAQIPFAREQKFSSLGNYRFDFYVNNSYLIEFDGKQHFSADGESGWFTDEVVLQTQERDKVKNEWCKVNNVALIRIPYYDLENFTLKDLILETSKYRVV